MVQVIQSNRQKPVSVAQQLVGGALEGGMSALEKFQGMKRQEQTMQQENEAAKRMGIDLSGIQDPKMRQEFVSSLLQGKQNEQQNMFKSQENEKQFNRESKFKADQLAGKQQQENQEKVIPFQNALESVNKMKQLRSKGNLGRGSAAIGFFGGEIAKDRGEYQTLGNSLIQFASSIPIRNKEEFEQLAGRLSDPSITDDESEGILSALERIIQGSLSGVSGQNGKISNKQNRPPLTEAFE
jgi:hypothetical protein